MIQVRTLGPLKVTMDGATAPTELTWRHNLALLLYLARTPAHRCTRDHAIGLLWPEKEQDAARQSLREAVRTLRRFVGETHLRAEADQLELAAGAVELDTDRLDELIATGDLAGATPLVDGKFAEGFALPNASPFEDWLHAERWHWRSRAMDALVQHAEQRITAGDLLGADDALRRATNLDPSSQRALRTRIRRLALADDRDAALGLVEEFARGAGLDQGGAVTLEPETKELVERVRSGRVWKLPPAAHEQDVAWRRVPLFGREHELTRILTQWREARAGRVALVIVEAVAGGGKTRLGAEAMARVALDGGVCVATRAVPSDQEAALSGVIALARGGLLDAPGVAAASPAALGAVARDVSEWMERFPAAAKAASQPLGTALIEVLRAASVEQPLLLVLDDAQWLDDASLDVLETLIRDLARARVMLLLTAIPEPTTERLAQLRTRVGRDVPGMLLRPATLDEPALRALVDWAFPSYTSEQRERVARRIAADSAGIPLLAVEICHAIAQGLDINSTSGAWPRPLSTLDQTLPGDLPATIVAAIRVGFNCLSAPAQAALSAAAVLGDRVPAERIGRAAGLAATALDAALDELEWRRWLVADPRGYSFVARIVREVVDQDMVGEAQRQRILNA